ncbi:MAG: PCI domain-containing protein [Tenericutes bacterium]|nr:PCI domain-containing protein [Mycoplasmatota bacterium]
MKKISLLKEAERLNVPLDVVLKSQKKLLRERKIQGIIDTETNELVSYNADEIDEIIELLNEKPIKFKDLSSKYDLTIGQSKLLVSDLVKRSKVSGLIKNKEFISSKNLEALIKNHLGKSGDLNPQISSEELEIPVEKVMDIITQLENQMFQTVSPYSNVPIENLTSEVGLSEGLTIALLKRLIEKERIVASIDMVNKVVTINQAPKKIQTESTTYVPQRTFSKNPNPSSGWYLVPLFFGLLGGIFGYTAVKNDDPDMANTLLWVGILSSVIGLIIFWSSWSSLWF